MFNQMKQEELSNAFQQQSEQFAKVTQALGELSASRSLQVPPSWMAEFEAATELLSSTRYVPVKDNEERARFSGIRA